MILTTLIRYRFFSPGGNCPDADRDSVFAETLLESILAESSKKDQKQSKILTPTILRPSILRRNRSGSGTDKQVTLDANVIMQQDDGCEKVDKSSKVSKWTKVKAAFRSVMMISYKNISLHLSTA